jgi:glycerophosphoryl diester phosphodiesterase
VVARDARAATQKQVGILGIFSDWSGTVSYYASCMGLK